jgi:serine/threonine-protein phosphatase 2A regulatory subunit B
VKQTAIKCKTRRVFDLGHHYRIHSLSLNSDGEHFLSSDEFRITLWNVNISNEGFSIVDWSPASIENIREVITAAEFHPRHCNIFAYGTSRGTVHYADMRQRSLCDHTSKAFVASSKRSKGIFSDMVNFISCVKFSADGRYLFVRDYFAVTVWDMQMESRPLKTISIQEFLSPKLCDLYENDALFDKFEIAINNNGNLLLSGAYDNCFLLYDLETDTFTYVELPIVGSGGGQTYASYPRYQLRQNATNSKKQKHSKRSTSNADAIDFTKKVLHVAWHPRENTLATVSNNNLFLYSHIKPNNNTTTTNIGNPSTVSILSLPQPNQNGELCK